MSVEEPIALKARNFGKIGNTLVVFIDKDIARRLGIAIDVEYIIYGYETRLIIAPKGSTYESEEPLRFMHRSTFKKINSTIAVFLDKKAREIMKSGEYFLSAYGDKKYLEIRQ